MGQKKQFISSFYEKVLWQCDVTQSRCDQIFFREIKKKERKENEGKKPDNQWSFLNFIFCLIWDSKFNIFSNPENSLREKGRKNKKMILKKKMKKKGIFFSCQRNDGIFHANLPRKVQETPSHTRTHKF